MANTSSLVSNLDPPSLGPPNPVYSNMTIVPLSDAVKMITVSGQVARDAEGNTPDGLAAQMELCLANLKTCLDASGARVHDMTRFMYYITEKVWGQDDVIPIVMKIITPWLQGHRPASCFLVVKSLSEPQFLCEFEAQAVVKQG